MRTSNRPRSRRRARLGLGGERTFIARFGEAGVHRLGRLEIVFDDKQSHVLPPAGRGRRPSRDAERGVLSALGGIEFMLREAREGDALTIGAGSVGRVTDELALLLDSRISGITAPHAD